MDLDSKRVIAIIGDIDTCLPLGTLIKTSQGLKPIEKVKEVLSYNLKEDKIESKKAVVHNTGKKQIIKIHTSKGILKCSLEHKWFILRNNKIDIIKAKDLKETDYLLLVE